MRGKFPVDLKRTPIVRLPMVIGRGQLTSLLGLHCKMRAVALCAKMNVALGIESEIVAAGNVVQPSFLHLEILRCGAQRSHHWSDVEICHEVLPSKICKGSGHSSRFKCLERRQVAVTWRGTNIARDAAFLCSRANAGASATRLRDAAQ